MPAMSRVEAAFCRSSPWRGFTRRVVLPWVLDDRGLQGDVLEIGAGSGANSQALIARCPDIELVVTDVDPAMAAAASKRLAGLDRHVRVEVADVTDLPLEDSSLDAVVSLLMLHHVIAWESAFVECARVLKPGGRLVGYDLLDTRPARLIHRIDRSEHRLLAVSDLKSGLLAAGLVEPMVVPAWNGVVARFDAIRPLD